MAGDFGCDGIHRGPALMPGKGIGIARADDKRARVASG